jgi:endonuclease/exonuclease/phosphatase family metal-dependent hydrolase
VLLDLLTVNLWGLPWPLAREHARRKRLFRDYLAGAAYHLVAIQELWRPWHRALELERIVLGRSRGDSGLALTGTLDIDGEASVRHFRSHAGADRLKRKGLLSARVTCGRMARLAVHVTHLQAGARHGAVRARQIDEILRHTSSDGAASILMGDFNFYDGNADDRASCARLRAAGFADAAAADARSTYCSANPYARRRDCNQRFDRIFLRDGGGVRLRTRHAEVLDSVAPFSDHHPLRVRVQVGD